MARKSLRQRVLAGETVLGSMMFELLGPAIPQLLVNAGAEYVIYDMEHTGTSLEIIKAQISYCRGLPIAPMAPVPRAIVEATHYPPRGRRGAAFGFAHDDYAAGDPKAKMRTADARTLVIAQIETERGLEQAEAIAAVDGIDVLWVGHFDLTNFLGIPGQFDNPIYVKAVDRIVAAGRKHKKGLGFMAASADWARQYKKLGFNMLAAGPDQALFEAGVRGILSSVEDGR